MIFSKTFVWLSTCGLDDALVTVAVRDNEGTVIIATIDDTPRPSGEDVVISTTTRV